MLISRLCAPLLLALLILPVCAYAEPARLAILADEKAEAIAALLTDKLSPLPDIELVERADIDKVLSEHSLSASGNLAQALTLGGLLRARGVLIVETLETEKEPAYQIRLVAVDPGIVLAAEQFAGKGEELAQSIQSNLAPLLPKLTVEPGEAVPLSLLNLRGPLKGHEFLEHQLAFLLSRRLTWSPKVLLLERWRMEDLAWEKALGSDAPFWKGSYIVDGQLQFLPASEIKLTIYLRPPNGQAVRQVEVSGKQEDLMKLANTAADQIIELLSLERGTVRWDDVAESKQYFSEAIWAFRAGLYQASRAASEASYALGNRDPKLLFHRFKTYTYLAYPDGAKKLNPQSPINNDTIDVTASDYYLRSVLQAFACYREYVALNLPAEVRNASNKEGLVAGKLILTGSRILQSYYAREAIDGSVRESLAELRRGVREASDILYELPEFGSTRNVKVYQRQLEATYLPLWYDTPADTIGAYRRLLQREIPENPGDVQVSRLRVIGADGGVTLPWIIPWNQESAEQVEAAWNEFLTSMESSKIPSEVADGILFRMAGAKTKEEKTAESTRLKTYLEENADRLADLIPNYIFCLDRLGFVNAKERHRFVDLYLEKATEFDADLFRLTNLTETGIAETFRRWQEFRRRVIGKLQLQRWRAKECDDFEAELIKKYPALSEATRMPSLVVSENWCPLGEKTKYGQEVFAAEWTEDRVWILHDKDPSRETKLEICALTVPSFTVTDAIVVPHALKGRFSLYLSDGSIFVVNRADQPRTLRYDRKARTWEEVQLPDRVYTTYFARGDDLFAGYSGYKDQESGILRWNGATKAVEVVASNRRRPGLHRFDDRSVYEVFGLCGDKEGRIGAIMFETFYWHLPGSTDWTKGFRDGVRVGAFRAGDEMVYVSFTAGIGVIDSQGKLTEFPGSQLLKAPENPTPVFLPPSFEESVSRPTSLGSMPPAAYFHGTLYTLRMLVRGSDRQLLLNCCNRVDEAKTLDVSLEFKPLDPENKNAPPVMRTGRVWDARDVKMTATSHGLVFRVSSLPGLWFLPKEAIEQLSRKH